MLTSQSIGAKFWSGTLAHLEGESREHRLGGPAQRGRGTLRGNKLAGFECGDAAPLERRKRFEGCGNRAGGDVHGFIQAVGYDKWGQTTSKSGIELQSATWARRIGGLPTPHAATTHDASAAWQRPTPGARAAPPRVASSV